LAGNGQKSANISLADLKIKLKTDSTLSSKKTMISNTVLSNKKPSRYKKCKRKMEGRFSLSIRAVLAF
jgi:hypothetical protein